MAQTTAPELAKAIREENFAHALAMALKRWDKSRAPAVAELIERLGPRVPGATPAVVTDDISKLRLAAAQHLVEASATSQADPRTASALTTMLLEPPFTSGTSRGFWSSLLEQLADRHADPRTAARLRPALPEYLRIFGATKMGERMQRGVRELVTALDARFPTTPADREASELVAALLPPASSPVAVTADTGSKPRSGEELLALVHRDPDDDGARLVYADWLLEHDDPRGEFIMLQFRRHRSEALSTADEKRMQQLAAKHMKDWIGPLAGVTRKDDNVFGRGFLERCTFQPRGAATALALDHPSWTTVRELKINSNGTKDSGEELLAQPAMRHLRAVRQCNGTLLEVLVAQQGLALETLEISWLDSRRDNDAGPRAWTKLKDGEGLPKLAHLICGYGVSFTPEALGALLDSALAKRLKTVTTIVYSDEHAKPFLAMLRERPAMSLTIELFRRVETGKLRVSAGEDGKMSGVVVDPAAAW